MKKTIKLVTSLLATAAAVVLTGCNKDEPYVPTEADLAPVEVISLNTMNVPLIISTDAISGEVTKQSFQLEAETLPRGKVKATVKYESSDKNIATVDDSGKISAVSKGQCTVTAKSFDGKVTKEVNVFVSEKVTKNAANKLATAIKKAQADSGMSAALDTLQVWQYYDGTVTVDEELYQENKWQEVFYVSKSQAFFALESDDLQIKTFGGNPEYSHSGWCIYTTENYDTYLFHINGDAKTYMVADSTSFISKGKSRYEAMLSVLDNLFTSGSGLITRFYDDIIGEDEIKGVKSADIAGSSKDDELMWNSAAEYTGQSSDIEYEKDYNIPGDAKFDAVMDNHYLVEENAIKAKWIDQSFIWKNNDKNYVDRTRVEYEYNWKNVELEYPDKTEFTKVDTIFDL